jgi:hypothetical protein
MAGFYPPSRRAGIHPGEFSHGLLNLCTSVTAARADFRDAQGRATTRLLPSSRKLPFAAHAMGNYG